MDNTFSIPKTSKKYLLVIGGPTGIGKTEAALQLALKYDCPIISSDSRQFYREMNIGTAKPTPDELSLAKHYFVNNLSIHDSYSVGDFEREVIHKLDELFMEHSLVIMVGGTGLYINAVLHGLDSFPNIKEGVKEKYNSIFSSEGISPLQELIKEKDPIYAAKVDLDNPHRLIRALSVMESSGKEFSSFLSKKKQKRSFETIKIVITLERHLLYDRINKRVDLMIRQGLVEEVKSLVQYKNLNALKTVGYSEIFDHLDGKCFLSESIEKIKQNTRNYAKRQTTWFRNQGEWEYFEVGMMEDMTRYIEKFMSTDLEL